MKKYIILTACCLMAAVSMAAQDASGVAMVFEALPRESRALSLGGVSALSNTSMKLMEGTKFDIQASYGSWAPKASKSTDINASLFARFGGFGISASFATCSGEEYAQASESGMSSSTFTPKDMLVTFGLGYGINDFLSVSGTFRYMSSTLSSKVNYSAFAGDVFVAGKFGRFKAAAGVSSLGTKVKTAAEKEYPIPTAVTLVGEYSLGFAEKHAVNFAAQADYFLQGGIRLGVGAEYAFNDMVFARLGYCLGAKSVIPSFFSTGLGFKFKGISLNASYLLASETVGGSFMAGLGYSF